MTEQKRCGSVVVGIRMEETGVGFFAQFEDAVVLEHYRNLRRLGRELNQTLIQRLPKKAVMECAKKLGLVRGKILVFQNENEMATLFDHCLYSYRPGGKSVIELHLEQSPPPPDSHEMALLLAMQASYYSLFSIEEVIEGKGLVVVDGLRQAKLFILDIGLGNSAAKGMLLAGRIMPIGELYMSTGALIPLQGELVDTLQSIMERLFRSREPGRKLLATPGQEAAFAAQVIRAAIKGGALEYVGYSIS
jgi:hypothetical protein